jgi:hypothetical protein
VVNRYRELRSVPPDGVNRTIQRLALRSLDVELDEVYPVQLLLFDKIIDGDRGNSHTTIVLSSDAGRRAEI